MFEQVKGEGNFLFSSAPLHRYISFTSSHLMRGGRGD